MISKEGRELQRVRWGVRICCQFGDPSLEPFLIQTNIGREVVSWLKITSNKLSQNKATRQNYSRQESWVWSHSKFLKRGWDCENDKW